MRAGALLYLEEFNRVPEETLNVLITVLAEGEIAVPRLGLVQADPGFRLVAAMNPFDAIGTARVSHAIADRICRVVLGYQDAAAERDITTAVTGQNGQVVDFAVALTRATREHPDVRMGSSVRGAIDLVLLLAGLARLRGEAAAGPGHRAGRRARRAVRADPARRRLRPDPRISARRAARRTLAGRRTARCSARPRTAGDPDAGSPDGQGKADRLPPTAAGAGPASPSPGHISPATSAPLRASASALRRDRGRGPARRTTSRAELAARHPAFGRLSPEVGQLDEDAVRPAAGGRPGRGRDPAGRPGPGHRPGAARRRPAAGARGSSSGWAGPGRSRPGAPAGSAPAAARATSTWTGPWTGGRARGRRPPTTWSPGPGTRTAGRCACSSTAAARCRGSAVAIAAVAAASVVLAAGRTAGPGDHRVQQRRHRAAGAGHRPAARRPGR